MVVPEATSFSYNGSFDALARIILATFLTGVFVSGAFELSIPSLWVCSVAHSALELLNFIIHEAGHPLFAYGGTFLGYLGGTILQLLVPLCLLFGCISKRAVYSAWISLFWFGHNFIGISNYMADARSKKLQLFSMQMLSGRPMSAEDYEKAHDWGYLFGKFGLLDYDSTIALITLGAGSAVMLLSIAGLGLAAEPLVKLLFCKTEDDLSVPGDFSNS